MNQLNYRWVIVLELLEIHAMAKVTGAEKKRSLLTYLENGGQTTHGMTVARTIGATTMAGSLMGGCWSISSGESGSRSGSTTRCEWVGFGGSSAQALFRGGGVEPIPLPPLNTWHAQWDPL